MIHAHAYVLVSYTRPSSLLLIYSSSRSFVIHTQSHTGLISLPPFHPLVEPYNIVGTTQWQMSSWRCDVTGLPHSWITPTTILLSPERIWLPVDIQPTSVSLSLSLSLCTLSSRFLSVLLFESSQTQRSRVNVCEFHKFVQIAQQQPLCPQKGQKAIAKVPLFDPDNISHSPH